MSTKGTTCVSSSFFLSSRNRAVPPGLGVKLECPSDDADWDERWPHSRIPGRSVVMSHNIYIGDGRDLASESRKWDSQLQRTILHERLALSAAAVTAVSWWTLCEAHRLNSIKIMQQTATSSAKPRETSITVGLDYPCALSSEPGHCVQYFTASPAFLAFGPLSCTNQSTSCCPPFRFQLQARDWALL